MNLLPVDEASIKAVRELEATIAQMPQILLKTTHEFWAGCYARTIMIPKGGTITGAQIKIPTLLIISGDVVIGGNQRLSGYHVLTGNAGRKNAFHALEDTWLTMIFATKQTNVKDVEEEFTNESENLGSRREGEKICQVM